MLYDINLRDPRNKVRKMITKWQVHKFGGTSVGNAERYKGVTEIVISLDRKVPPAIVVSAMKGVTDKLINLSHKAQKKDASYVADLEELKKLHLLTITQLLKKE